MKLVSGTEAAALVGVKPATLRKWVQRGKLQPFTIEGGRAYYLDLDVYEAERATRKNTAKPMRPFACGRDLGMSQSRT